MVKIDFGKWQGVISYWYGAVRGVHNLPSKYFSVRNMFFKEFNEADELEYREQ